MDRAQIRAMLDLSPEDRLRVVEEFVESVGMVRRADEARRHRPPTHSRECRQAAGDLDCLGTIDQGRGYDELLPEAIEMTLADGQAIRVLGLTGLIDAKERAGRPKDLAALPVLRATLDEARRRR